MPRLSLGAGRIYGEAAFEILARAQALEKQGHRVLHFEIGEPDMETPDHIAEAGIQAIRDRKTHYVPSLGLMELREAVVEEIKNTRGYTPDIGQVVITPGLKPGIFFSMLATVDPGDEVIFPEPGYPAYGSAAAMIGADPVPVPLLEENGFRMNPDDVRQRVTEKTKAVIINSPQNPTGSVMTNDELREIHHIAREHDFFVISDEVYSKMTYDGIPAPSITTYDQARERTILLDGFSKCYVMTGWRLGYMVVPAVMADRLRDYLVSAVSCTAAFTQWAGLEALTGDQSFIPGMMDRFTRKRDRIVHGLNQVPGMYCRVPEGAFYAFVNIRGTGMTSQACSEYVLNECRVATVPGTAFGAAGEGYLRFSYATSLDQIDEAVERLITAFS
ncbi:MAG: pyridoxal phosphate-dependent aminotransferase [Desulfotignum sp.]|nr:pyridoxal phosphate-dependent aminotransferase [Desulfotignum sp.]MCF8089364.1 pyridoxal phosphate-dependent aminotransferase [Desulfotignum sp.]MCF8138602.1 pyridoxal phosphate-dependent aminotransferase [Desulfotignum sp.]